MDETLGKLIEPPPVPFRFGAPGWYVLLVLGLLLLGVILYLLLRYYRANRYRRNALLQLDQALNRLGSKPAERLYTTNTLLKRVGMHIAPRQQVADKRGAGWIDWLNKTGGAEHFAAADEQLLHEGLYLSPAQPDAAAVENFIRRSRTWIRKHHRKHAV